MNVVPSKVLHVRNLAPNTEANDLRQYVASFGQVAYVVMLPKYQQALIEMGDESQATTVIQYSQMQPVNIKGRDVVFTFSKSTEIKRSAPAPEAQPQAEHNGEHVLLITILNPLYAIDVSVLHSILHPYGNVLRIVIFHKNGTQALAEFDDPQSALIARQNLDGKDIYDGCCTLRISFSRTDKLNVRCNNDKTRDFTNPNLPPNPPSEAPYAMVPQPGFQPMFPPNGYPQPLPGQPMGVMGMTGMAIQQGGPGTVLMVYNLPADITCDNVFNLFCLYGNVIRVKLLASKEGTAMVQMGDKPQADQAINLLNAVPVEGNELSITFSKHPYIAEPRAVMAEANGENDSSENPICKDYTQSPMNRFTRQPPMAYKHIYRPTPVLYFSNCAPSTTEESLTALLTSLKSPIPTGIKFFASTQTPKRTGLMEFASEEAATAAVLRANNQLVEGHTVKLAFSMNSFATGTKQ